MSRLSRAAWRLVPQRLLFRPDGSMTRLGLWSFHRITRRFPEREFITATEQRDAAAANALIHAEHIARGLFDERYPYRVEYRHEPTPRAPITRPKLVCPIHGDDTLMVWGPAVVKCLYCGSIVEEVWPIT